MRCVIVAIVFITAAVSVQAQNIVYDENAEVRTVDDFSGIEVSGAVSLYLSQGPVAGVAVSAGEQKYNPKIKTAVSGGVLHLSVDGGIWNGFNWTNKKLKAYVTVVNLNRLEVSGASYVRVTETLKSDNLKLEISGASEIKGSINVTNLDINMSGASIVRLSGSATTGVIEASGASRIKSYDLSVGTCKISSSGASDVRVTVNNEINADASGGSTIYYKGAAVARVLNANAGATIKNRSANDGD